MITVIAHYRAQPGKGDEVAGVLAWHVAASRTEAGCTRFEVYRSTEDVGSFELLEQYMDDATVEAHRASPHFHSYVEGSIVPLLSERWSARYEEVEPYSLTR
jgi:quinol monooxygenase YgiN